MDECKQLFERIDKALVQEMPVVEFPGRIVVVQSAVEAERAVAVLSCQARVGFDTETRPSFRRGHAHKVALMQISTADLCFLFRLNMIGMPPVVADFLADDNVGKVGLSLKDDFLMLRERSESPCRGFIDLQEYVQPLGVKDLSLQKLYANFFGQRISKSQRLTNWEADVLTDRQKQYAAIDAWACLRLYDEITRLRESGNWRTVQLTAGS